MNIAARSYLTAGFAALSAGAIALSPVQPIPNHLAAAQQRAISTLSVNLAATVNPFQAWSDAFTTTVNNGLTLAQYSLQKPFPLLTTIAANQVTYLQELFAGKGELIWPQIQNNLKTLFEAPLDPGPTLTLTNKYDGSEITWPSATPFTDPGNLATGCSGTPGGECGAAPTELNLLTLQLVAGGSDSEPNEFWDSLLQYQGLYRFTQSFASGLLVGALGPLISPLVSLSNSFTSFGANLKAGKYLDAFYDIVNIPANMTNAFFNGAGFWELNSVIEAVTGINLNPETGLGLGRVGLNLGGLLNLTPVDNPITEYNGGVLFDAIAGPEGGGGFIAGNEIWGVPVGLGGSLVHMGQFLGEKLLVTPPSPGAAVAAAAAVADAPAPAVKAPAPAIADVPAPALEAPAVKAPAPAVADVPAPALEAPAPAVADAPAPALEAASDVAAAVEARAVEAPAPQSTSAPTGRQRVATSDNDGNVGGGRAHHAGARGHSGRG
jgi:hypothetical protein